MVARQRSPDELPFSQNGAYPRRAFLATPGCQPPGRRADIFPCCLNQSRPAAQRTTSSRWRQFHEGGIFGRRAIASQAAPAGVRPTEAFFRAGLLHAAGVTPRRRAYHNAWQPGVKGGRWTNRGGRGRAGTTFAMGFESRSRVPGGAARKGSGEAAGGCIEGAEGGAGQRERTLGVRAGPSRRLGGTGSGASLRREQECPRTGRGAALRC
jgi:hypothetical protein